VADVLAMCRDVIRPRRRRTRCGERLETLLLNYAWGIIETICLCGICRGTQIPKSVLCLSLSLCAPQYYWTLSLFAKLESEFFWVCLRFSSVFATVCIVRFFARPNFAF